MHLRSGANRAPVRFANRSDERPSMSDSRYEIVIYFSSEDEAFIAEAPELPGCAADGITYEEALSNVQRIIAEWIETANELGRSIPEPRGRLMFA
jgi:predicted RNase H-like HicB family nuclease